MEKVKKKSNEKAIKEGAYKTDIKINLRPGIIKRGGKSKTKKRKRRRRNITRRKRSKGISLILKRIRSVSRKRNY